jgi:hypothetical protein
MGPLSLVWATAVPGAATASVLNAPAASVAASALVMSRIVFSSVVVNPA